MRDFIFALIALLPAAFGAIPFLHAADKPNILMIL
jgi:hypothetical protein